MFYLNYMEYKYVYSGFCGAKCRWFYLNYMEYKSEKSAIKTMIAWGFILTIWNINCSRIGD